MWKELPEEEKRPYIVAYEAEMAEYNQQNSTFFAVQSFNNQNPITF